MSLLDLAYIILPPSLALAMAGFVVVQGNRRTATLDADIAAYRVRKAEARRAAMAAEQASQPAAAEPVAKTAGEPNSAERVKSPVAPAVDVTALVRFYEETGLAKRLPSTEPDLIFTANGRTYMVQAKARIGVAAPVITKRQAAMLGRARTKRRMMNPTFPALVVHDPARTYTPR